MSIQCKDSSVCQKSLPLDLKITLLTIFFLEDNLILIIKCTVNGHHTIELEKNVVRIVNLFR